MDRSGAARHPAATPLDLPQQFLNFFPLPQGQGSFLPTFCPRLRIGSTVCGSGRGWAESEVAAASEAATGGASS
jgi:hypothetical protein